jgi:hypothetical protein
MATTNCRWKCPDDWQEWSEWLASGLHGRNRWRLSLLLVGILFAGGRRTVTSWLRAAGISDDFQDYYYFLAAIGRKTESIATGLFVLIFRTIPLPERLTVIIDDSPTKRYGPKVEGADIHRNPTPGPSDQKYLYGHIWVTISLALRHPLWGAMALPLRAMLYVRQQTIPTIPAKRGWKFATKLVLAADIVNWIAALAKETQKRLWVVIDGGYVKEPFLKPALAACAVIVGRLRKDAALRDLPRPRKPGEPKRRGRPPKYGKNRISLAKRAAHAKGWETVECTVYNKTVVKTYKTFLATYRPVRGMIRVVLVKEDDGSWLPLFCSDVNASVTDILEEFSDRATIEQDFHDVKEVWGSGQQQVRNIWTNVAVYNLNLWMHTLVDLWSWNRKGSELCDRSDSPWDDPDRRPSHADRRKALRQHIMETQFSAIHAVWWLPRKITQLARALMDLAA